MITSAGNVAYRQGNDIRLVVTEILNVNNSVSAILIIHLFVELWGISIVCLSDLLALLFIDM